ncbi:hypothetical protein MPSEU_000368700 [Mayamaea pseudoterrestris]|nr:hypothetical protein MPSEU_000368700 [Mayamaea pseudoterrestris]
MNSSPINIDSPVASLLISSDMEVMDVDDEGSLAADEIELVADTNAVTVTSWNESPLLPIATSRKPLSRTDKLQIIKLFKKRQIEKKADFHASLLGPDQPLTKLLHAILVEPESRLKQWKADECAGTIIQLHLFDEQSKECFKMEDSVATRRSSKPSSAIASLRSAIIKLESHRNHLSTAQPKSLASYKILDKNGKRVQDSMVFDSLEAVTREACAVCGQKTINAFDTPSQVQERNERTLATHKQALADWQGTGANPNKKPRCGKTYSQRLVCFSYSLHCGSSECSCYACKALMDAGMQRPLVQGPLGMDCSCSICKSTCCAGYYSADHRKIAEMALSAREGDSFQRPTVDFCSTVRDVFACSAREVVDGNLCADSQALFPDICSMTAVNLLHDPLLQGNMQLRLAAQEATGALTTYHGGFSIDQIRKNKRLAATNAGENDIATKRNMSFATSSSNKRAGITVPPNAATGNRVSRNNLLRVSPLENSPAHLRESTPLKQASDPELEQKKELILGLLLDIMSADGFEDKGHGVFCDSLFSQDHPRFRDTNSICSKLGSLAMMQADEEKLKKRIHVLATRFS